MIGFLNIDKPAGMGSRLVTTRLSYKLRPAKVGHIGTLDPLATGVLVLAVGKATRLAELLHSTPKSYVGEFLWNRRSNTEDIEGEVSEVSHAPVTREKVEAALPAFRGEILQTPPAFSAKWVNGQRAYKLARRGRDVALPPKAVQVHTLEVCDATPEAFRLKIACGTGTYIRSLGRDIAAACGGSAVMSSLRRTAVGPFHAKDAVSLNAVEESPTECLLPASMVTTGMPELVLNEDEIRPVLDGRPVPRPGLAAEQLAFLDGEGELVAVGRAEDGWAKPGTVVRMRDGRRMSESARRAAREKHG